MRLFGITITVLLLGIAIWLCRIVWPPDAVRGQRMRLASIATKSGDHIELIQLWNGDGYLTKLYHDAPDGTRWDVVIDPDAKKSWTGRLIQTTNPPVLIVRVWDETL